jgi:hypothetical protein
MEMNQKNEYKRFILLGFLRHVNALRNYRSEKLTSRTSGTKNAPEGRFLGSE